ncbi:hypothetical protein CTH30272_01983 [Allocatenococcus thiocycli]|nr:hypothetical protein CTH30272_01983 [Catenococcus thiocycli]
MSEPMKIYLLWVASYSAFQYAKFRYYIRCRPIIRPALSSFTRRLRGLYERFKETY